MQPRRSTGGGVSEYFRGFTIYFTPSPEREWSFRARPGEKLQSYRSAFQARRAINELLDGISEAVPRRDTKATSIPTQTGLSSPGSYGEKWSDAHLKASIDAYRRMLEAEGRGRPVTKREVVESLMSATGRTKGSIEMRLQNISAVLDERGLSWIALQAVATLSAAVEGAGRGRSSVVTRPEGLSVRPYSRDREFL